MPTYNIGSDKPFRLTTESCIRLVKGLMNVGGKLTYITQDKTVPHTCAIMQVEILAVSIGAFKEMLGPYADCVELAYSYGSGGGEKIAS